MPAILSPFAAALLSFGGVNMLILAGFVLVLLGHVRQERLAGRRSRASSILLVACLIATLWAAAYFMIPAYRQHLTAAAIGSALGLLTSGWSINRILRRQQSNRRKPLGS